MKTLVSVVIPAFNSAKYLKISLDSILKQTYKPIEIIVVNDGSTDETEAILSSINDKRLKVVHNTKNSGIVYSLNAGVSASSGDLIARMDADDIAHPARIEQQVKHFEKRPDIAALGTYFEFLNHNMIVKFPTTHNNIKSRLFYLNSIGHPTAMINRKIVGCDLVYKEEFKYAEDHELWSRLSHKYLIENLPINLLKYRIHAEQISSSFKQPQNDVLKLIRIENTKRLGIVLADTSLLDQIFTDSHAPTQAAQELAMDLISMNNQRDVYPKNEFRNFIQNALYRSKSQSIFAPKSALKHYSKVILKRALRALP